MRRDLEVQDALRHRPLIGGSARDSKDVTSYPRPRWRSVYSSRQAVGAGISARQPAHASRLIGGSRPDASRSMRAPPVAPRARPRTPRLRAEGRHDIAHNCGLMTISRDLARRKAEVLLVAGIHQVFVGVSRVCHPEPQRRVWLGGLPAGCFLRQHDNCARTETWCTLVAAGRGGPAVLVIPLPRSPNRRETQPLRID